MLRRELEICDADGNFWYKSNDIIFTGEDLEKCRLLLRTVAVTDEVMYQSSHEVHLVWTTGEKITNYVLSNLTWTFPYSCVTSWQTH